ncbi:MAG: aminotransferase class I/II-fold pyridoxal phosphate-dependent enzyme, partial [Planctomycetota bacterium]|nr:aminotransferase class I/II-fold pyridoxal phosphate-dependent enzyme [Planctomycetota bacterium]
MIDLRSDTVTRPDPAMREAMAAALVGDDVLGDDPTVKQLERQTAELLGKPAAVFTPSGSMANQIALRSHTEPGDEAVMDAGSHMYFYEGGAPAALSGVMCRLIDGHRGLFTSEQLQAVLRPANEHFPRTKLLCLENTHNRGGGSVWPLDLVAAVTRRARQAGLACHLDGARLWNAAVASGVAEARYAEHFDSVSVCFSKGLGAPVGSCLAGGEAFIARARRFRKQFGGSMRQSGSLAAGALYALEHNRAGLADDHANARLLAEGIARLPGFAVDVAAVETNMVYFQPPRVASAFVAALAAAGVAMLATGPDTLRAVTHRD